MTDLLDVPDPDKKINEIVNEAIKEKQAEIEEKKKEMEELKQQESGGIYYSPIDTNNDSSLKTVATSMFSIFGDVLNGFQEATEHVKSKVSESQMSQNEPQSGGTNTTSDNNDVGANEANEVIKQADQLLKMIGGANGEIKAYNSGSVSKGANNSNSNSNSNQMATSTTPSLGKENVQDANDIFSTVKDLGIASLKTGIQLYGNTLSKLIDMGMGMVGENKILDTPINQLSPDLNKKVLLFAGVLKELSTNPATKQAVKEIAQAIAVTAVEILKEIQPQVDKVTDQATEMMDQVATKLVTGATGTGVTVAQAFISAIPMVGGVINMMIAIAKGFNTLMITYKVFVDKSSPMMITAAHTIKNTEDTVLEGQKRIMGAVDNAKNIMKQSSQIPNPLKGGFGSTRIKSVLPIHYKIQNGGKRLKKTMKLFHNTLPKMKFSHLRKTSRARKKGETKRAHYSKLSCKKKKTRKRN